MSPRRLRGWTLAFVLVGVASFGARCGGLLPGAFAQLHRAGVDKYLDQFTPVASTAIGDGWTRHDYDPDGGDGPLCIAGTPYAVFTPAADPTKLLILEQGGGACWQDFYNCNVVLENNALPPFPQVDQAGLWNRNNPGNPFADYSVVYLPYCDGSVLHKGTTRFFRVAAAYVIFKDMRLTLAVLFVRPEDELAEIVAALLRRLRILGFRVRRFVPG